MGKAHLRAIPKKFFNRQLIPKCPPKGNIPNQNNSCNRTGQSEIRTARLPAFAGCDPFLVMADRTLEFTRWSPIFFGTLRGNELKTAATLRAEFHDLALIANKQMSGRPHFLIILQFRWPFRTHP